MITPLDIENKRFSKQMMNGYNVEEVDDFLDELTVEYGKNYKEANELRAKVEELNKSLVQYKTIETTLQNTLVMAQTTAEEVKNVAKQKADQIVDEAKANAQKKVDELNNEILLKQKELDDVKKQFDIYKAKMESLLISQLELIKEINKKGITIIMVSHDINFAINNASKILHLKKNIKFFGNTEDYAKSEVGKKFIGGAEID